MNCGVALRGSVHYMLLVAISCLSACVSGPVQQSGAITSTPSGATIYLINAQSNEETKVGTTPTPISLVSTAPWQWILRAELEGYKPQRWFVHGGSEISHNFFLLDPEDDFRRRQEELRRGLMALQEKFRPYGFDVLGFVDYAKANLKTRSEINFGASIPEIDFREFKGNIYIEVKINYLATYNTLRVSMYDAASMTFDEIVKKMAIRIATDFKKQDTIAGFIFAVTYTNKDFLKESEMPKAVTNEFILPKEACQKYANLDITNQDLIDRSYVLVDGERIALKLQFSK